MPNENPEIPKRSSRKVPLLSFMMNMVDKKKNVSK